MMIFNIFEINVSNKERTSDIKLLSTISPGYRIISRLAKCLGAA